LSSLKNGISEFKKRTYTPPIAQYRCCC